MVGVEGTPYHSVLGSFASPQNTGAAVEQITSECTNGWAEAEVFVYQADASSNAIAPYICNVADFASSGQGHTCGYTVQIPCVSELSSNCEPTSAPTSSPTFVTTFTSTGAVTRPPSDRKGYFDLDTPSPTEDVSSSPTKNLTVSPTATATGTPTGEPTATPTGTPTGGPTAKPTGTLTRTPTGAPTGGPTGAPTGAPTGGPTATPTGSPSLCHPRTQENTGAATVVEN